MGTLVCAGLVFASGIDAPWLVYFPWVASLIFWGLPHGAADHALLSSLLQAERPMPRALGYYICIMAVYGCLWLISAEAAITLFLVMTAWHWGSADAWRSFDRVGSPLRTPVWFGAGVARGIVPILAPLVLYRDVVASVIVSMSQGMNVEQILAFIPSPAWILGILVASQLAWLLLMKKTGAKLRLEIGETVLILLVLVLIHPIAGVGAYFTFWHALGHDRRLERWYGSARHAFLRDRSLRKDQTGIMMVTLAGLILMWVWMPPGKDVLAIYLIAISVMTLPHMVVVWGMDKAEAQMHSNPVIHSGS